jgi:hypothetical protein
MVKESGGLRRRKGIQWEKFKRNDTPYPLMGMAVAEDGFQRVQEMGVIR